MHTCRSAWIYLNPIQDGPFRVCSQMGGEQKICHAYPAIMELGTVIPCVKMIQKYMNHVTHSSSSADISIFSSEISNFCYIKKYSYRLDIDTWFLVLLTYFESLKIFLINMVVILMMSAKMATLGFLKIKVFWNKVMTSWFMSMTPPAKFYYVIQIAL